MWDTLCLIHVSRAGLTEPQVLALLEELGYCGNLRVQVLEWSRLRSAFWPWVQEKTNGLLTITHQSLSQAINLLLHGVDGFMLFVLFSFILFQSLPQNSCFYVANPLIKLNK